MIKENVVYKRGKKYIRSTHHPFDKYLNKNKSNDIKIFIDEYRRMANIFLEELWNQEYNWYNKQGDKKFSMFLKHSKLNDGCPQFLEPKNFNSYNQYKGCLSGRALSSLCHQLMGIIRGCVRVAKKSQKPIVKPNVSNILPEISLKHVKFIEKSSSTFSISIKLSSMFNVRGKYILIPLKLHKMDEYYANIIKGRRLNSIQLNYNSIAIRYEIIPNINELDKPNILGVDIGIRKICAFSNGIKTSNRNNQGKSLEDILKKLDRCKKGSKNYKNKLIERDCFINEVLNKIDLLDVGVLRVEDTKYLKERIRNNYHHWKTSKIKFKIKCICQINQVDLIECPSMYKSQRCFNCGFVHTKNRNHEKFKCINCLYSDDADINAAKNNSIELIHDNIWDYKGENKKSGFFWIKNRIFINKI